MMATPQHGMLCFQKGSFLDVNVCSNGTFVTSAHRIVLSAFSSHFEMVLANAHKFSSLTLDIDSEITGTIVILFN